MLDLPRLLRRHVLGTPVGWEAVAHFFAALVFITGLTFAISGLIHRLVERPMVRLGRRLEWTRRKSGPAIAT
jgi:peptidoglycan/LPS O-acetylase OafA/YrhL